MSLVGGLLVPTLPGVETGASCLGTETGRWEGLAFRGKGVTHGQAGTTSAFSEHSLD